MHVCMSMTFVLDNCQARRSCWHLMQRMQKFLGHRLPSFHPLCYVPTCKHSPYTRSLPLKLSIHTVFTRILTVFTLY